MGTEIVIALFVGLFALMGWEGKGRRDHEADMAKLKYHQEVDNERMVWRPNVLENYCPSLTPERSANAFKTDKRDKLPSPIGWKARRENNCMVYSRDGAPDIVGPCQGPK